MTSRSVAEAIQNHLEGIGEYGRPCGVKPWVVADIYRHFTTRPPLEGAVFLLRAEGYSWGDVARELAITRAALVLVRQPLVDMASLLEAGVVT